MWPFKAGMFLNFLLQMVHSTGLSPMVIVLSAADPPFLTIVDESPGVVTTVDTEPLFAIVGKVNVVGCWWGIGVKLWWVGSETIFPPRDSLSSCSISCNCCAVNPLLENMILVSPRVDLAIIGSA